MINPIPDNLKVPDDYAPSDLTEAERMVWLRVMPQLIEQGIITTLDLRLCKRYCQMSVILDELIAQDPKHYMVDKYNQHIRRMEDALCLTPHSYKNWLKAQWIIREKRAREEARKDKDKAIDFRPKSQQLDNRIERYFRS